MDKQREKFEQWVKDSRRYDVEFFCRTEQGAEALQNALDDDYVVWQSAQKDKHQFARKSVEVVCKLIREDFYREGSVNELWLYDIEEIIRNIEEQE